MRTARPLRLAAVVAALLGLATLAAPDPRPRPADSASAESAGGARPGRPGSTPGAAAARGNETPAASFTIATVDLQAVDAEATLPDNVRRGVQGLLDGYLDRAVLQPLRSGQPAGDLSALFAGPALDRMSGPDRAALVDEGLPKATQLKVTTAEADLTALIGPDGVGALTAGIKVVVTGAVEGAPLTVERTGELLLAGDGPTWRVAGYDMRVTRDAAGSVTTTTVRR